MTVGKITLEKETDLQTDKTQFSFFNRFARLFMASVYGVTDISCLIIAILITYLARIEILEQRSIPIYSELFILVTLLLVILFSRQDLYPAIGLNKAEELRRIVTSTCFAFLIMVVFMFIIKTSSTYSRLALLLIWCQTLIYIPCGRYMVRHLFIRLRLWGEPVVIIGDLHKAMPLANYFRRKPHFGIRPVSILRDERCSSDDFKSHPPLSVSKIKDLARDMSLHTVMLVVNDLNHMDLLIDRYRFIFPRVILIKYQHGKYGMNTLKTLDFSDILGLQVRHNLLDFWSQVFKRTYDIAFSILGMVILLPLLFTISVFIWLSSPGPLFYRNVCIGRGGRSFGVLKFRTMYANAKDILNEILEKDAALKREWDEFHKLKNDPRITKVGKFLRKYSLDELPQFWNILLGEMSLVGPRPFNEWEVKDYGPSFEDYLRVTPGLTGLWQISGRSQETFYRRAQLDSEYIQRWSFWLDIYILLCTVKVVLLRNGAE